MSALHRMRDELAADSPAVLVLLGLRSLVRRLERDAAREPIAPASTTLDAPALALLGVMALARGWRRYAAATFDGAPPPPPPARPDPPAPPPRTLLR